MASLDFPSNPTNGQTYALNGVTYYYNASMGAWLTQLTSMNLSTSSNTQVLFNDAGIANGSSGLVFNKVANTLTSNSIVVTGNVSIGTTIANSSLDLSTKTDAIILPKGTTAQRPTSTAGMVRYNSDLGYPEYYSPLGSIWLPFFTSPSYTIDIMLVGGGGSGGAGTNYGGGGGAGGLIYIPNQTMQPGNSYSLIIGSGGAQVTNAIGNNGANTTGFGLTAVGGGQGGNGEPWHDACKNHNFNSQFTVILPAATKAMTDS